MKLDFHVLVLIFTLWTNILIAQINMTKRHKPVNYITKIQFSIYASMFLFEYLICNHLIDFSNSTIDFSPIVKHDQRESYVPKVRNLIRQID